MGKSFQSERKERMPTGFFVTQAKGMGTPVLSQGTPGALKEQPSTRQRSSNFTAKETIGVFGFGILISWIFLCYFSGLSFFDGAGEGSTTAGGQQWLGLCVFALVTVPYLVRSDFFTRVNIRRFAAVPLVSGLILPALSVISWAGINVPSFFQYLAWGINGFASASAVLMWANYFCSLPKDAIVASVISASLVAGFWFFLIMLFPASIMGVGIYTTLVLSTVCILIYHWESASQGFVSRKDSEDNIGLDIKTSISLCIISCAHGYLLHRVVFDNPILSIYIIAGAFVLSAMISWLFNRFGGKYALVLAPYFRISFLPLTIGFILIPFLSGIALVICVVILLAILFQQWLSLFVNITFAIKKYEVQAFYLWTRTQVMIFAGLAIGWGSGFIAVLLFSEAMYRDFFVTLIFTLVFVALFALSATVSPYGSDHLTISRDYENDDSEYEFRNAKKTWAKACDLIAEHAKLTPREIEVFYLLAKGRNSKVIERELFISKHTVKSHNYNIYRKIGVESQQELIDKIESVHVSIKL